MIEKSMPHLVHVRLSLERFLLGIRRPERTSRAALWLQHVAKISMFSAVSLVTFSMIETILEVASSILLASRLCSTDLPAGLFNR